MLYRFNKILADELKSNNVGTLEISKNVLEKERFEHLIREGGGGGTKWGRHEWEIVERRVLLILIVAYMAHQIYFAQVVRCFRQLAG